MHEKTYRKKTKTSIKYVLFRYPILLLIALLLIGSLIGLYAFFHQSPYKLAYHIKPISASQKIIEVSLTIRNLKPTDHIFELVKGDVNCFAETCQNQQGEALLWNEKDGLIKITTRSANIINYTYKVKLGQLGKHGHQGNFYEDLLTFSGENVFIFPLQAVNSSNQDNHKYFSALSFSFDMPADWAVVKFGDHLRYRQIVPFVKKEVADYNQTVIIKQPTWADFYNVYKSCYAFGKFTREDYPKGTGTFSIYTEPAAKQFNTPETRQGLNAIYDYYAKLFGFNLPHFSLILLRKDAYDNSYVIGGSSTQTLGTTFDPNNPRDWQLMGHRFFHAFFDTKVRMTCFHSPPQLWFYEGLATYYENLSMESLPDNIQNKLGLKVSDNLRALYKRYVYMHFKDPGLLAIAPMSEPKIQSQGMIEFLHYTQAPLIIKAIEDLSYTKHKTHNRILKYIITHSTNTTLGLQDILKYTLGDETDGFARHYLFSPELLPLWSLSSNKKEKSTEVINQLNDFENTLFSWFQLEISTYPKDNLTTLKLDTLATIANQANVNFATDPMEMKVNELSPTIYCLLKQYALRSKTCGINYHDPSLRFKLLNDPVNLKKWQDFIIKNL